MKITTAILTAALITSPAMALKVEGDTLKFSKADQEECKSEGGCMVVSKQAWDTRAASAFAEGWRAGAEAGAAKGLETCKGTI